MPTTTKDVFDTVGGQVLQAVRETQDAVAEGVRAWAELAGTVIPKWPTSALTDELPKPAELIDNYFDFAGELLAAQREFAHKLVGVTESVTEQPKQAKAARAA